MNGIPVIASAVGGLPEAVGHAGILINDYDDSNKWVSALRDIQNNNKYEKLSRIGPSHAKQYTNITLNVEKLRQLLFQAIKRK